MTPVYTFQRDHQSGNWLVFRLVDGVPEPLFACLSAEEARALADALGAVASGNETAKCDAFRTLGLAETPRVTHARRKQATLS